MLNVHKLTEFLNQKKQSCVIITEVDLLILKQSLKSLGITKKLLTYPSITSFPYDPSPPLALSAAERIKTIELLQSDTNFCLLLSPLAWLEKRPALDSMIEKPFPIQTNDVLTHRHLIDVLTLFLFQNTDIVTHPGQYAVRGDRIDIFPPNITYPIRIDFFGDTIEAIKAFDSITQKSIKTITKLIIQSASEFSINQSHIDYYRANYAPRFCETEKEMAESMIIQKSGKNWGHLWPLFYETSHHISYFWKDTPAIFIEPTISLKKIHLDIENIYDHGKNQGRLILPPDQLYDLTQTK